MCDAAAKPRWYHVTPDRFLIGLLAPVLVLLAADRFELLGLTRGSVLNAMLAAAIFCLGMLAIPIWFVVSLLLRRRFQFGLRSLVVLMVNVAILCSWFAVKIRPAHRRMMAEKAILSWGGKLRYDAKANPKKPLKGQTPKGVVSRMEAWCRDLVDADSLLHVVGVRLHRTELTGAGMAHLKELTNLESLSLSDIQLTDAELVHLRELTRLEYLSLTDIPITDAGLVHLSELTNLEDLTLYYTRVGDAGMVHLKQLTNLHSLDLSHTQVSDPGLEHLKELTNLQSLLLSYTRVTDTGLVHLEKLTNLETLWLHYTQVTDGGVEKLQQALPNCRILR